MMQNHTRQIASRALCALAWALLVGSAAGPRSATAGTVWDGGGGANTNWGYALNWDNDTLPSFGSTSVLTFGLGGTVATVDAARSAKTIVLYLYDDPTFTINGSSTLSLYSGINASSGTVGSNFAISAAIGLAAADTWSVDKSQHGSYINQLTVSGLISGTGSLTTNTYGGSKLTLTGSNSYSGLTTVNSGTLNIRNSNALGATTSGTIVNTNAALEVQDNVAVGAEPLTISGTGISTTGALRSISGTNSWGGAVTLAAASSIGVDSGSLTINGRIGGAYDLSKVGSGTLILSPSLPNTFTGRTNVSGGVLNIRHGGALGTTANATYVSSTAALELQGDITVANEGVYLQGTGISGNGALRSVSGTNAWSGPVTLWTASSIGVDLGTLTVSGNIAGNYALTKVGSGTLVLSGTNSFSGTTSVNGGVLRVSGGSAIPDASGVTVGNGALLDVDADEVVASLNASGGVNVNSAVLTTGSLSGSGTVSLTSGSLVTGGDNSSTTFSGSVGGDGNLIKNGTGTFVVQGNNSYTGATNVNGGVLNIQSDQALGTTAGGTTVANGAALEVQHAAGILVGAESLSLVGTGISGNGALRNVSGTNVWGGTITLQGPTTIQSDAGNLTLSHPTAIMGANHDLTLEGAAGGRVGGAISLGSGTLTKNDAGTWTLAGTNTYTGDTVINGGRLTVEGGNAIPDQSRVTLANAGSAALLLGANETVGSLAGGGASGGNVMLNSYTLMVGANNASTAYSGIVSGTGRLTKIGTGTLTLSGMNSYSGGTNIDAGILQVSSDGNLGQSGGSLAFGGGTLKVVGTSMASLARTVALNSAGGTLDIDSSGHTLTVASAISGPGGLTKAGPGTLALSGINGYAGTTAITGGGLRANDGAGLPANSPLQLRGGVLEGNGTTAFARTLGADVGQVEWGVGGGGFAAYGGRMTVQLGGGTGTVVWNSGSFVADGQPLIFGSFTANNVVDFRNSIDLNGGIRTIQVNDNPASPDDAGQISGTISNGALIKTGSGELVLSSSTGNTYEGGTSVLGGTIMAYTPGDLGSVSGTIAPLMLDGGTLKFGAVFDPSQRVVTVGPGGSVFDTNGQSVAFASGIGNGGTGGVTKAGAGLLTFQGVNTYAGPTAVNAGTLALGADERLPDSSALVVGGTGTFDLGGFFETVGPVTLNAGTIQNGTLLGSSYVVKSGLISANLGSNVASLSKEDLGTVTLSGANSYSGPTAVKSGTLVLNGANSSNGETILQTGGKLSLGPGTNGGLASGTLTFNGGEISSSDNSARTVSNVLAVTENATFGGSGDLIFSNTTPIALGTARTLTVNNPNTTLAAPLSGVGITKGGSGMLTLAGNNTYTGAITADTGTLSISSGVTVSNTNGYVGYNNGSTGSVTLSGSGATWNNSGTLYVGYGGNGTLNVLNGACVSSASGQLSVSYLHGGGTVTVNGAGSTWNDSGPLTVGWGRNGTLNIQNGGTVSSQNATIGWDSYSTNSTVTVTGPGSTWINSDYLYVGDEGVGRLNIQNGGSVSNTYSFVGLEKGSSGTVTVNGAGSAWTNTGTLWVGDRGTGVVNVQNGATVSSTGSEIGNYGSSVGPGVGTVTVTGAGSTWTSTGTVDIGDSGRGTLNIQNGGAVSNLLVLVARLSGSTGTVTVTGANSTWNCQNLYVGGGLYGSGGTGSLTVSNGGQVDVTNTLEVWGTGTLTLGGGTITGGSISASALNSVASADTGVVNGSLSCSSFNVADGAAPVDLLVNAAIHGYGSITKVGAGALALAGVDTYAGSTTINAGKLIVRGGSAIPDQSAVTLANTSGAILSLEANETIGSLAGGGASGGNTTLNSYTLTAGNNNTSTTYSGVLSGTGRLSKSGSGTLTLSGTNSYSGGTAINGGVLQVSNNANLGDPNGAIIFDGGTLKVTGTGFTTLSRPITLDDSGGTLDVANPLTVTSTLSGDGGLVKAGVGTLKLSSANNYRGTTKISGGSLTLAHIDALAGSTLDYNAYGGSLSFGSLAAAKFGGLEGGQNLSLGNVALAVGANDADTLYSGALSGAGSLAKIGSGTLTLSGANSYTGGTTVSAGALNVTGTLANNGSDKVSIYADASGDTTLTRRVLGSGMPSYAGVGSAVAGGELATRADIMAGTASGTADVSMAWRARTDTEETGVGGGLLSEILSLDGIHANGLGTDDFLLQMTYDTDELSRIWGLSESDAIAQRRFYLGTFDGSQWGLAVGGNFGGTAVWKGDLLVSIVAAGDLAAELGWYGVDTTTHVAWAVLDHNSDFAVGSVPEPSSLVIFAIGVAGVLPWAWRKRKRTA